MKATILTEASVEWGMGHFQRCRGLDQALRSRGTTPSWFVVGDSHGVNLPDRDEIKPIQLPNWDLPSLPAGDLVVVDSYHATLDAYRRLASRFEHRIWIDDQGRLDYPEGHVVSANPLIRQLAVRDGTDGMHVLSGFQYQIMRKEFEPSCDRDEFPEVPRSILVLMGGTDPLEATPMLLASLRAYFPQSQCRAVVPRDDQRARWGSIEGDAVRLLSARNASEMRALMEWADLCLCAGGQALLEAVRLGTPTIAVEVADNQRLQIQALKNSGAVLDAGRFGQDGFQGRLEIAFEAIRSPTSRRGLCRGAETVVDGRGADRILDLVLAERAA